MAHVQDVHLIIIMSLSPTLLGEGAGMQVLHTDHGKYELAPDNPHPPIMRQWPYHNGEVKQ